MASPVNCALVAALAVDADHLHVADEAAGPDAPHEAALRHLVELGDAVGQHERAVVRHAGDAGPEDDLLGALEGGGDEHVRGRDVLPLGGEMLADPGLGVAELVQPLDLAEVVLRGSRPGPTRAGAAAS